MTDPIHIPTQDEDLEFAYFLVRENWLRARDLEDLSRERAQKRRPFGEVALHRRVLTPREVARVLRQQAGSQTRFGEVAVEMGIMTLDDVVVVLRLQREELPSVIDLLLERGMLSETDVEHARAAFTVMREGPQRRTIPARSLSEMSSRPEEHAEIPAVETRAEEGTRTVRPPGMMPLRGEVPTSAVWPTERGLAVLGEQDATPRKTGSTGK